MKISIIIPTRNREQLLGQCLQSIYQNTFHKKNLEILILADQEDPASQAYVNRYIAQFGQHMDMRLLTRAHSNMLNRDYYNWAAHQSTGELVWIYADDLMMCSPGWDEKLEHHVQAAYLKFTDRVFCVSLRDNTPPPSHKIPKFPCFPMFTREAITAMGWALHPAPPNWGVDYINFMIYHPLGRIVELHDTNYVNHVSYHTKQVEPDETCIRIGATFNALKMRPEHNTDRILCEEVPKLREQLMWYIRNKGGNV